MSYPRICLLVIGDGRDDLKRDTMQSWHKMAREYELVNIIEVDDREHELGFCGAWRRGMQAVEESEHEFDYVFHLEEDWLFNRTFSIADMARILDRPWATIVERETTGMFQVALQRQAISDGEIAAGGVVAQWPREFKARKEWSPQGPTGGRHAIEWLEHKLFLTTNPNLISRYAAPIAARHIADPPRCEEALGKALMGSGWRFAYLGRGDDEPWITHVGTRQGTGY